MLAVQMCCSINLRADSVKGLCISFAMAVWVVSGLFINPLTFWASPSRGQTSMAIILKAFCRKHNISIQLFSSHFPCNSTGSLSFHLYLTNYHVFECLCIKRVRTFMFVQFWIKSLIISSVLVQPLNDNYPCESTHSGQIIRNMSVSFDCFIFKGSHGGIATQHYICLQHTINISVTAGPLIPI